ncbi:hypothetical protein D3C72_1209950 [compost metagenome]
MLGDAVLPVQTGITLDIHLGVFQLRLILQQGAFGLEQGVLVRTRVNFGQQVASLDHLPFLEIDLHQLTADATAHVDGVQRSDRAQRLVVQREITLDRRGYPHRNRPGSTAEPWTHSARLAGVPGHGFLPRTLFWRSTARPEFPAQGGDDQQDKQAEQPATGTTGSGGLH